MNLINNLFSDRKLKIKKSYEPTDSAIIRATALHIFSKNELSRSRLLKALKALLWVSYPSESLYKMIIQRIENYNKDEISYSKEIVSEAIYESIEEKGFEYVIVNQ